MFQLSYSDLISILDTAPEKVATYLETFVDSYLQRQLSKLMDCKGFSSTEELMDYLFELYNLQEVKLFLFPSNDEVLRDPELWRDLVLVTSKKISGSNPKVLYYGPGKGSEILSLILAQKKLGSNKDFEIHAYNDEPVKLIDFNSEGFTLKELDGNKESFKAIYGKEYQHQEIFESKGPFMVPKDTDFNMVHFHSSSASLEKGAYDVVLMRNYMCYYKSKELNKVMRRINTYLKTGGYLILGVQEELKSTLSSRLYELVDDEMKIYKKIR